MNEKRKALLKLCADRPRTTRELVGATGDRAATVASRLHDLVEIGAVKRTRTSDKKPVYVYQSVPGWSSASPYEASSYKPLGICVWGVWM